MNENQINIAIAKACGVQTIYWKAKYNNHGVPDFHIEETEEEANKWPFKELGVEPFIYMAKIPKYTKDLNACHEMENTLTDEQAIDYFIHLNNAVIPTDNENKGVLWAIFHATAPQRCEAFCKVMGIWEGAG